MGKFFLLKPEVAGHFGKRSVVDRSARPPVVSRFHYEFDGWLGDDLLETIGTYLGTLRLAAALQSIDPKITGIAFDTVEVSKSGEYRQWEPLAPKDLPDCVWFKITGRPGIDDFGQGSQHGLVVSERVLAVMRSLNLNHCDVAEYSDEAASDQGISATRKDEPHLG